MFKGFLKNQSAVFSIISVITVPVLLLLLGSAVTTGDITLKRNNHQNAADLAVLSAHSAYRFALSNGDVENVAKTKADNVMENVYAYNNKEKNQQNSPNKSISNGTLSIEGSRNLERSFLEGKDLTYNVTAESKDAYQANQSPVGWNQNSSVEVTFSYDASTSMLGGVTGFSGTIADSLQIAANNVIDTLFDTVQPGAERQLLYTQSIFERDIQYSTLTTGDVYNKQFHKAAYAAHNEIELKNMTNLRLAMQEAIELINKMDPVIKRPSHNEVVVFMTDGVPSVSYDDVNGQKVIHADTYLNNQYSKDPISYVTNEVPRVLEKCDAFKSGGSNRYLFTIFYESDYNFGDFQSQHVKDTVNTLGREFLKKCATAGNGQVKYFYNPRNHAELQKVYEEIAKRLMLLSHGIEVLPPSYKKIQITR